MNNQIADKISNYRGVRGPDWRWRFAIQKAQSAYVIPSLPDEIVSQAERFVKTLLRDDDDEARMEQHPVIAAAKTLWDEPNLKQQLMILTLGDVPREQIAERLAVSVQIVTTTELLFFDIREMREATDWINCHIMLVEEKCGNVELATHFRAAFWGGPLVAQALLDDKEKCEVFDEVQRLARQESQLQLKARQALDIPLNTPEAALRFTKMYLDYKVTTQRLELSKERFRRRCEQDIRKHELARRRMDALGMLAEADAKESQRRSEARAELRRAEEKLREIFVASRQEAMTQQQQAAKNRAASSPLARLTWSSSAEPSVIVAPAAQVSQERSPAAA